jgi:WD40 repeat protein
MITPDDPKNLEDNQSALQEVAWAIENNAQFSLILAHCNSISLQKSLTRHLQDLCSVEIQQIDLEKSIEALYTTIKSQLRERSPQALIVFGLESLINLPKALTNANVAREEFRLHFPFPLVIWANDRVLHEFIRLAPDFYSWAGTVEFNVATDDLIQFLQKTTDEVFDKVLEVGAGRFVSSDMILNVNKGFSPLTELQSARQELKQRGVNLEPILEVGVEFVLGRDTTTNSIEQSRLHYERSLALFPTNRYVERKACVLHSLGVWWRSYADKYRAEYQSAMTQARGYFQQCTDLLRENERPDLVARFINALADVLHRLEQWNDLEASAQYALTLHQSYSGRLRLARTYGFLAEVFLSKSTVKEAQSCAENALKLVKEVQQVAQLGSISSQEQADLELADKYHQGWYLFSLAKAYIAQGKTQEGTLTLEASLEQTHTDSDPDLVIKVLQLLRNQYFQKGEYLKAFKSRQKGQELKQQYNLIAFIGAGRLQPKEDIYNPCFAFGEQTNYKTITQEIAASGRGPDIKILKGRIERPEHKLTILYGPSGVGKSSLLQAGLIPVLKHKSIETRDVLPVLQQYYRNWLVELTKSLTQTCKNRGNTLSIPQQVNSPEDLLSFLKVISERGGLTVLVFDQFEEFFFTHKDEEQRKQFYEFLRNSLNIPFVQVILSLREDYLYYLLECNERLVSLDIVNNDILSQRHLHYIGNFTPEGAKAVIQSLTAPTPFQLTPELIDELIRDLAGELGCVRPIELQVVGAQLQAENITTIDQYKEKGPKNAIVGRFLEDVVKDCGLENERFAKLTLYLLTDENNTRPLKTRSEFKEFIEIESDRLDLILTLLVDSGLVLKIPQNPEDCYQLVHDYLVHFIRKEQSESAQLFAQLEKEREQRKLTEEKLKKALQQQLKTARRAAITLGITVLAVSSVAVLASLIGINTYLSSLSATSSNNEGLDRLISAIKAGKNLRRFSIGTLPGTRFKVLSELSEAIQTATEYNRLEGHQDDVTYSSFSSDGKMIATASNDNTVKVWWVDGSHNEKTFKHEEDITHVSWSQDGTLLATASKDKTAKVWKVDNSNLINNLPHPQEVTGVSISPDNKLVATSCKDKKVRLWNLEENTPPQVLPGHEGEVTHVSFSPDGQVIASADDNGIIKIWDSEGSKIRDIDNYGTQELEFLKNDLIQVTNKNNSIKLYTITGDLVKAYNNSYDQQKTELIDPRKKLMISADRYSSSFALFLYILYIDNSIYSLLGRHIESINDFDYSLQNQILSSASNDDTVKLWKINIPTEKLTNRADQVKLYNLEEKREITLIEQMEKINSVTLSPDGKIVAVVSNDNLITLWDNKGEKIKTLDHQSQVTGIYFSPDSQLVASISSDNQVKLWKTDGEFIATLPGHTYEVKEVKFSPDSQIIATRGDDNFLKIWNRDGTERGRVIDHLEKVNDIEFSSNSQIIASLSYSHSRPQNSRVKFWLSDRPFSQKTQFIEDYGMTGLEFSPDSRTMASIHGNQNENYNIVKLWAIGNSTLNQPLEEHKNTIKHESRITDVSFSPDSDIIATASKDNTIQLSNSRDGSPIKTLLEHTAPVESLSFSPDGEVLASVSDDNTIKLWSREGKLIETQPLLNYKKNLEYQEIDSEVKFSPDGNFMTLVSSIDNYQQDGYNYTINFWSRNNNQISNVKTISGRSFGEPSQSISWSDDRKTVAWLTKANTFDVKGIDDKQSVRIEGHTDWVNSAVWSPDGQTIVSASDDNTIKIWDSNGKHTKTISKDNDSNAHQDKVNSVSFHPDNKIFVSASDDKTLKLWTQDGNFIKDIGSHTDKVTYAIFSPDGKTIASLSANNNVKLWDLKTGEEKPHQIKNDGGVKSISFNEKGNILALEHFGGQVTLHFLNGWIEKQATLYKIDSFSNEQFSDTKNTEKIVLANNEREFYLNNDLDDLLKRSCNWAKVYLKTNPNLGNKDKRLCDDILSP